MIEINPRISTIVYQEDLNLPWLGVKRALGEISDEELAALRSARAAGPDGAPLLRPARVGRVTGFDDPELLREALEEVAGGAARRVRRGAVGLVRARRGRGGRAARAPTRSSAHSPSRRSSAWPTSSELRELGDDDARIDATPRARRPTEVA